MTSGVVVNAILVGGAEILGRAAMLASSFATAAGTLRFSGGQRGFGHPPEETRGAFACALTTGKPPPP
jgi:hypothetical protein